MSEDPWVRIEVADRRGYWISSGPCTMLQGSLAFRFTSWGARRLAARRLAHYRRIAARRAAHPPQKWTL